MSGDAGEVIIAKGWLIPVIPLSIFSKLPRIFKSEQLNKSVSVVPSAQLATVCMFAAVPIFSTKSVLIAKSYALAKSCGRMYSKLSSKFKLVSVGKGISPLKV